MSALATETTTKADAAMGRHQPDEVFYVEHLTGRTGQLVELARYTVTDGGQRILCGQRVDGHVRVVDRPVGAGRSYLVERELEQDGPGAYAALKALIADYLGQTRQLDAIPMRSSVVHHYLVELAS